MFSFTFVSQIQDESGEIEVIHWVEEGSVQQEFCEGSLVKVTGSVRWVAMLSLQGIAVKVRP